MRYFLPFLGGMMVVWLMGCGGGGSDNAPAGPIAALSANSGSVFKEIKVTWSSSLQPDSWRVDVKPENGTFTMLANVIAPSIREVSVYVDPDPAEFSKWTVRLQAMKGGQSVGSREIPYQFLLWPVTIGTLEVQFDAYNSAQRRATLELYPTSKLSKSFWLTRMDDGGAEQQASGSAVPATAGGFHWVDSTVLEARDYRYTAYPMQGSTKGIGSYVDVRTPLLAPEIESVDALSGGTRIGWSTLSERTSSFTLLRSHLDLAKGAWINDPSSPELPSSTRFYDDPLPAVDGPTVFRVLAKGASATFQNLSQSRCLPGNLCFGSDSLAWSIVQFPQLAGWFRTLDGTWGSLQSPSSPGQTLAMQVGTPGAGYRAQFSGWSTPAALVCVAAGPNGKPQLLDAGSQRLRQAWFDGALWQERAIETTGRQLTSACVDTEGGLHQVYRDTASAWHYQFRGGRDGRDVDVDPALVQGSLESPTALPGGEVVCLDALWKAPALLILKPDGSWERQVVSAGAVDGVSFGSFLLGADGTCYAVALCSAGSSQDLRLLQRAPSGQPVLVPIPGLPVQGFSELDLHNHVSLALSPSGKVSISLRLMASPVQIVWAERQSGANWLIRTASSKHWESHQGLYIRVDSTHPLRSGYAGEHFWMAQSLGTGQTLETVECFQEP